MVFSDRFSGLYWTLFALCFVQIQYWPKTFFCPNSSVKYFSVICLLHTWIIFTPLLPSQISVSLSQNIIFHEYWKYFWHIVTDDMTTCVTHFLAQTQYFHHKIRFQISFWRSRKHQRELNSDFFGHQRSERSGGWWRWDAWETWRWMKHDLCCVLVNITQSL